MAEPPERPTVETLTARQREVLALLAKGKTNFEIAEALGVSLEGAKYHVREIMGRLGVESREQAAAWWERERRAPVRLRRGFARFVPRVAIASVLLALVGGAGVAVALAVAAGRGGEGAPAYVPLCGEGDIALSVESKLLSAEQSSWGKPAVSLNVQVQKQAEDCYLTGALTLLPVDQSLADTMLAGSAPVDTILTSGAAMTFRIENWCESAPRAEFIVRLGGASARHLLDYPPQDCSKFRAPVCGTVETPVPCPTLAAPMPLHITTSAVNALELLPRCDPRDVLARIDSNPASTALPPGLAAIVDHPDLNWRYQAMLEGTAFGLSWTMAERPRDCEYQNGVRIRLLDSAGEEIQVDGNGADEGMLVRFRRATAPGNGDVRRVHLPGTGGSGDYGTETSLISHAELARWVWGNWCGEDRSTATIEVTTAAGKITAPIDRPACVDRAQPSILVRSSFGGQ